MNKNYVKIVVPFPLITIKTAAWGLENRERYKASQEAIRHAVQNSPSVKILKGWLESRTKLFIKVKFYMKKERVHKSDLDSLLSDLFNPIIEGACGPRPKGKPIPQTKDALFWRAEIEKVQDDNEKTIIEITPLR